MDKKLDFNLFLNSLVELDPMTHGTPNLDNYSTSISQKLQNGPLFYMYVVVFEHDKV